jgi:hypothetical protein
MWGLRVSMPKRSMWRVAQFDTLRLRLIKTAGIVSGASHHAAMMRIPRLVT